MRVDLDALLDRVDTRFTMVVVAARRARQIVQGARPIVETRADKPVSVALDELLQGELEWEDQAVTWQ